VSRHPVQAAVKSNNGFYTCRVVTGHGHEQSNSSPKPFSVELKHSSGTLFRVTRPLQGPSTIFVLGETAVDQQ
jgi:hypothetical protein